MTIKVKPLVWEQEPRNGWKVGVVYARGYHLIRREDGWRIGNGFGFTGDVVFPDLEAAKVAAQGDYEASILSAIEPVDPVTIRAEALREAIAPQISEGIGAILRKFCDSDQAAKARTYLHDMPQADWNTLIDMLSVAAASAVLALIDKEQNHG